MRENKHYVREKKNLLGSSQGVPVSYSKSTDCDLCWRLTVRKGLFHLKKEDKPQHNNLYVEGDR